MARRSAKLRLDPGVRPSDVRVEVELDPQRTDAFSGEVHHAITLDRPRRAIRLHAVDLRVSRARLETGGEVLRGRIEKQPDAQMIEVRFDRSIPAGPATLSLAFAGRLRTDLCGLYGAQVGKRRFAFTQLEAADARKFFPCFDEPSFKARFTLSVTTSRANACVSNSPIRRTESRGPGRKTVRFAPTPPLSSYLVALAVGELEKSKVATLGPTEIRIWHTPGKRSLTRFGLEAARECLARLERYFAIPYPYEKLDLVAVPDFEFGAMENAGAVFFRETLLLLDDRTATIAERKRAAEVIAHELAHMWYGDLVTMAWWDDLWLNEAFATWMAFSIVDDWKPDWKMWHDFQHGRAAALDLDALRHTHPIYCDVKTPEDANENFDLITYEKGAAVVRMVERYLGAATFRRGVRAYIRRHREGNTVAADLWRALAKASGQDVEELVRPWIEQEGYPLVSIRRAKSGRRPVLEFRQTRFFEQPGRKSDTRWPIPWVGRIGDGKRGRGRLERRLLKQRVERVPLPRSPRFVYGNADEGGFFRPLHDATQLAELAGSLSSLPAVERMGLVDHQWACVRAGHAPIGTLLDLASGFDREPDADVLATLRRPLSFIASSLVPEAAPACADPYRTWLREHFEPAFEKLGWNPVRDESDDVRLRRAALLAIAGSLGESGEICEQAAIRCERYLANRRSLDANLADTVVALAARDGSSALHRRFVDTMAKAGTPQEQRRFLLALGEFRDPALVDASLELTLTDRVPTQDVVSLLMRLLGNEAGRERAWDFIQKRWPKLRRRVPPLLAGRLIESTPSLLTARHRREVAEFFRRNRIPSGERALRQALERFAWYRRFRGPAARDLARWLDTAG